MSDPSEAARPPPDVELLSEALTAAVAGRPVRVTLRPGVIFHLAKLVRGEPEAVRLADLVRRASFAAQVKTDAEAKSFFPERCRGHTPAKANRARVVCARCGAEGLAGRGHFPDCPDCGAMMRPPAD